MGNPLYTRHYVGPCHYHEDPSTGTVPLGYEPTTIVPYYTNGQ